MRAIARASQLSLIGCSTCRLVCHWKEEHAKCPRCGSALRTRLPNSVARSWAYLLTGIIFYIPANVLPVMQSVRFGNTSENTIMSGLMEFWRTGAWDIALIIFIASVLVPCTKFLAMGFLLLSVRRQSLWARKERTRLYCLIEAIGYWSMLDVIVIALFCALVQFKALSSATPSIGILFFGLVVIFTMLSATSFDPRLIWDAQEEPVAHG